MNSLKVPPYLNRRFAAALAVLILLIAASVTVVQADAPDSNLDTAQRDDVVREDNRGGTSGASDSGTDRHDPNRDTAERDDAVAADDGGGVRGAGGGGTDGQDPSYDTAERDDVVLADDGKGVKGAGGSGTDGHDPNHDTAERDDVVPADDGRGVKGAGGSGTDGHDPNYDTAERDDVVPTDDGVSGAGGSGTDGHDPNYDTAKRDDVAPADDGGGVRGASATAPAPTGLRVTLDTDDSVSLSWSAVSNAARYKVEYKASTSSRWLHVTYTSGTTATVDALNCNASYQFRVRARGDGSPYSYTYSSPSASVSETTDKCNAPAPTGLKVTSDTDDSVSLSWRSVTDAAYYRVEYKASSSNTWRHGTYASGTAATVGALNCNTSYQFRVRARGDGSPYSYIYGDPSGGVSETTDACLAPAPTRLRVTSDTDDSVSLSWSAVSNAAKYKVEYRAGTSGRWLHATYTSGTTATVDALNCNASYQFRVRARGDGIPYSYTYGDPSSSVSEATDLCDAPAPTGLRVTSDTDDSVSLSWRSVTGAALYKVEYKASSSRTWRHATYTSGTTATVDDLDCYESYNFRVRARGNGSTYSTTYGVPSASVSETTDRCIAPAPTGLRVTSDTDDRVSLSWGSVSGASLYKVEYKASSSRIWRHATYRSGTTATVDRLACNTGYDFRIRARGNGSVYSTTYGDASSSVSETTDVCIIDPPTGLRVTSDTEDSVSLSWSAVTNAAKYKVEYKASSSSTWLHAAYASGTTATVDNLHSGTGYDFRVRARGDGSPYSTTYSDPSASVSETTDARVTPAPTGLSATASSQTSVTLSWNAVTDAQNYKLERSTSSAGPWTSISDNISASSHTVRGLECNTLYYFKVSARGDGSPYSTTFGPQSSGDVSWSTTGCPSAPAPLDLKVTASTDTTVTLKWSSVRDAERYKLERSLNRSSGWTLADAGADSITGTSYTVTELDCNTTYYFRVSAQGDGQPYSATFGDPSTGSVSETTTGCVLSFGKAAYTFTVAEGASTGTTLGTVSATNQNSGGTISYSIVEGNSAGRFSIGSTTGKISVAAALDYELSSAYELTVKASNPQDSTIFDLSTVRIDITNVNEGLAFDLNSYQFGVPLSARNPSATSPIYVGAVRAGDPDADDIVTYSITAGNATRIFSVDGLGRIWANAALLPTGATDYTLTIRASDGNSHTDDATVVVKYTASPIVTLQLPYDRFVAGTQVQALVTSSASTGTTQFSATLNVPSALSGQSGSASPPSRAITLFSVPRFTAVTTIPLSRVFTVSKVGADRVTLTPTGTSPNVVISNGVIPVRAYDNDIAIGESYIGEWGVIPSNTANSPPNERVFSLTVPSSNAAKRKIRIDLVSGDRDAILVLKDNSGNVLEWNDDGGAGLNAKIVHELKTGKTYKLNAFTHWGGGKGIFELSVSEAGDTEYLTDTEEERTNLDEASFYVDPSATVSTEPAARSISGLAWKQDGESGCTSTSVSYASQGTYVCLEITGQNFAEGDNVLAILLAEAEHQAGPVPIGAVALKRVSSTTMRGVWLAQYLSRYSDGLNRTNYRFSVVGLEGTGDNPATRAKVSGSLAVSTAGIVGSSGNERQPADSVEALKGILEKLGAVDPQAVLDTLWVIYGERNGYSDVSEFARDFGAGALQGEVGVKNDSRIGYYAGWITIGFIPVIDISADLRDAFALETIKCGFFDIGCYATSAIADIIDFAAVFPGAGKIADTMQVGRITARFVDSGAGSLAIQTLKATPQTFKSILDGKKGYWAMDKFLRGRVIENDLFEQLSRARSRNSPKLINLNDRRYNYPVVDYFDPVGNVVISVKSKDLTLPSHLNISGLKSAIRSDIGALADKLDLGRLERTAGRPMTRLLAVVVPDLVKNNQATALREMVAEGSRRGIIVKYYKVSSGTPRFVEYTP